jgi:hypothetical protein
MKPWWGYKWGNNSLCGITHTRLRPGKDKNGVSYTITLECSHRFYRSALLEWALCCPSKNPTCPICRHIFDISILLSQT